MVVMNSSGGTIGPPVQYMFIDGGCLRSLLANLREPYPAISLSDLHWPFLGQGCKKVFYYDAHPPRGSNEADMAYEARVAETDELFNQLRSTPGFHVYEGDARRRKKRVEQKKVDVLIAVDMLTHAFRGNMERAILLSGDLDFKPLVDELVRAGMDVELWYPRGRTNDELIYAADRRRPITFKELYRWLSPEAQRAFPLPSASIVNGRKNVGCKLLDKWETASGVTAEIYDDHTSGQIRVIVPARTGNGQDSNLHIEHSDATFLRQYAEDCFEEFWPSPF